MCHEQKHLTVLSVNVARRICKHLFLAELPCGMYTLHQWRAQSNDGLPIWRYLHGRAHTICAVIVLRQPGFQRFNARLPSDVPVLPAEFSIGQPVEQFTIITQLITTRLQIKSSHLTVLFFPDFTLPSMKPMIAFGARWN